MKIDTGTLLILAGVGAVVVLALSGEKVAQAIEWRAEEVRIAACSLWSQGINPVELAPGIALAVYPEHFGDDGTPSSAAAERLLREIQQYAAQVTQDESICFSGEA